jgi:hypothetical protein
MAYLTESSKQRSGGSDPLLIANIRLTRACNVRENNLMIKKAFIRYDNV